jgi:PleD family two-component response regulator
VAYRYGGEEFSVLFPGSNIAEAERALEAIRASIESYRMAVRAADRPKAADQGAKRRGERAADKVLSVTVSIGVAAPATEEATPRAVLKAADEALYRAKKAGRNRLSR